MTKRSILCAALIWVVIGTVAQTADSIIIEHPNRVTITRTNRAMTVHVEGREGNPDYDFLQTHSASLDDVNITKERTMPEVEFKLPFQQSSVSETNTDRVEMGIFSSVWMGALFASELPNNLDINFSMEGGVELFGIHVFPEHSHWSFSSGLQFYTRSFFVSSHHLLLKDGNEIVVAQYPISSKKKSTTLQLLGLSLPLFSHYHFHPKLGVFAGVVINFNGWGRLETKYEFNRQRIRYDERSIYHRKLSFDIMAGARFFTHFGCYLRYSPQSIIRQGHGPSFGSFSTGILFDF